ncbi:hypothetical protein [Rhodopseudomonas palustris]|nr:hypothetical protein [Rhodopseudomonas palustris]
MRRIAETIGAGLGVPVAALQADEAVGHFGWLAPFMAMDMRASSAATRSRLNWTPTGPDLLTDLKAMDYRKLRTAS